MILRNLKFKVFTLNWTIGEELLLLDGLERYGLDNWNDVSEPISNKTALECQAHYYTFYYKSKNDPIPLDSDLIYFNDTLSFNNAMYISNRNKENILLEKLTKTPGVEQKKPSKDNIIDDETIKRIITRVEFDNEYLNNAEVNIADLEFYEDDTEEEKDVKFEYLKHYNLLLDNQFRQHKLILIMYHLKPY